MRAVLLDGADHVQQAQAAAGDRALLLDLDPLLLGRGLAEGLEGAHVGDAALEHVRVGDRERALGAVDLDDALTGQRRVEADQRGAGLAALELGEHGDGRRRLDGELLPLVRADEDLALLLRLQTHRGDLLDGAEEAHQGGEVVRADVQQRARALGEEEGGVGVEDLRALPLHGGLREQRAADEAVEDRALGGLYAGAEHGVGGAADAQAGLVGLLQQRGGGLAVQAERLLGPHVLARGDRLRGDLGVHGGDGQVHDDLHARVVQHVLRGAGGGDAVLLGLGRGDLGVEIAEDQDLEVGEGGEVRQVLVGDDSGADEADAHGAVERGAHAASPPSIRKR